MGDLDATAKRNVRPSAFDDSMLAAALFKLSGIEWCCGDKSESFQGKAHEPTCAIGHAIAWLEYHAGILSKMPGPPVGIPVYSGDCSQEFWRRLSAVTSDARHDALYAAACKLQSLEQDVLRQLAVAEAKERET